jgi:dTDP-4-amino-4,6-dideoxygalactose transaminase
MLTTFGVFSVVASVGGFAIVLASLARQSQGGSQLTGALAHAGNACRKALEYRAPARRRAATAANRERPSPFHESNDRLAAEGGQPVRSAPAPAWPAYERDEIEAVTAVLASGRVNQWTGNLVREFERSFAAQIGANYAVAVMNGSLALEVALRGLGIGGGDEVIVPSRSFIASASSVSNVGATPVFADVDRETMLITPETIAPLIGPRTKAIMPVHLCGRPCDMPRIMEQARRHGLLVIEDCAQSVGAKVDGVYAGAFGDASTFSFCQDKIITTGGEGGMALFANKEHWSRAWSYRDHGKSFDAMSRNDHPVGYRWIHHSIGSNWRMLEVQAAIGLLQLRKLESWLSKRNANAQQLSAALAQFPCVSIAALPGNYVHAYYRLECAVVPERLKAGWDRDRILAAFIAEGIQVSVGTCPTIYRERAYALQGRHAPRPNAERLANTSLNLLAHPTIDYCYLADCEAAIRKIFTAASA